MQIIQNDTTDSSAAIEEAIDVAAVLLQEILPAHVEGLTIHHNYHHNDSTIEEYVTEHGLREIVEEEWTSPADRDESYRTNDLWECHWGNRYNGGAIYAPTLAKLLKKLAEITLEERRKAA